MNHKNFISLLLICLLANACTDEFLDQEPGAGQILSEDLFSLEENITGLIPGAYQPMRWEFNSAFGDSYCMRYLYTDVRSDDIIVENKFFQPHSHGFEDFVGLTPSNVNVQGIWAKLFTGVSRANQIIQGLVQVKDEVLGADLKSLYLAEARFLRAYYYFELVKTFGDVPLFGDDLADVSDPSQIARKPVAEVYIQIENDLIMASEGLPTVQSEPYRATRGAALGLLSKVYLYQGKWQEAADAAQTVIDLNIYELEENYGDNFDINNEFGKESIFEISFEPDGSGGSWGPGALASLTLQFFAPNFAGTTVAGWSYNLTTPSLLQAFNDEGDTARRNSTIMLEGHEFGSPTLAAAGFDPIPVGWFDTWINSAESGGLRYGDDFAYSLKYFLTPEELEESSLGLQMSALNHKVLRYAEVLLILAEGVANGATGAGQEAFDAVRVRAGLPSKQLSVEAIKIERRLELATEGNRFHDLVRWGDAVSVLADQGYTSGRDEFLPVPIEDILLSGTDGTGAFILRQNPGY